MKLPAVTPVIKGSKLAVAAKRNGWHGTFDSDTKDGIRTTSLKVERNDESLCVIYTDNAYSFGEYVLFDRKQNVHCASVALERLVGWPDIIDILKRFPSKNKPTVVDTYKKLPFDHDDPAEEIVQKLYGKPLFWYSHEYNRLDVDVVLPPLTSNSKQYRIAPVGHRRIFHFVGQKAGFRSVLLDTIIKVG